MIVISQLSLDICGQKRGVLKPIKIQWTASLRQGKNSYKKLSI